MEPSYPCRVQSSGVVAYRVEAMAIQTENNAERDRLVSNACLAVIAAVVILIFYSDFVMF